MVLGVWLCKRSYYFEVMMMMMMMRYPLSVNAIDTYEIFDTSSRSSYMHSCLRKLDNTYTGRRRILPRLLA